MGWGTDFKADIYLNRQVYNSIEILKDAIKEKEDSISYIEKKIYMHVSANLRDIVPDEWKEEPIRWSALQVDELLASLKEDIIELYKLNLYLENYQEPVKE